MSMCRVFSCVVGRQCLLWPVHSLGKTLLAFSLLHFILQGQICLFLHVSLYFLLLHSSPLWWKGHILGVLVLDSLIGLHRTIALISHASKVILKILQARLQQYVNHEFTNVQAGFRKGRGTRHQIANMCWIIKKAREFQKNIYFSFIDYAKAFDCVNHNKLWEILKEMAIPDHLTCLLRNLYAG